VVLGKVRHPLNTGDFSSYLLRAQASKAKVVGLANAGGDTINSIKQAAEFGISQTMNIAVMVGYTQDVHSIGLRSAAGMRLSETYYWDLNDRTRAFNNRVKDKVALWPSMAQAGNYSATLHYL